MINIRALFPLLMINRRSADVLRAASCAFANLQPRLQQPGCQFPFYKSRICIGFLCTHSDSVTSCWRLLLLPPLFSQSFSGINGTKAADSLLLLQQTWFHLPPNFMILKVQGKYFVLCRAGHGAVKCCVQMNCWKNILWTHMQWVENCSAWGGCQLNALIP